MLFLCWLRFSIVKCRSCSSLSCDILHRGRKLQHKSRERCNISVFGGKVQDKIIFSSDTSLVLKACCVIWIPLELPEMKLFTFHTTLLYLPCNSCKVRYFNTPTFSENLFMEVDLFGKHQAAISSSGLWNDLEQLIKNWLNQCSFFTKLWNALYSWYFAKHCIALKMSISGADKSRIDFSLLLSQQLNFKLQY